MSVPRRGMDPGRRETGDGGPPAWVGAALPPVPPELAPWLAGAGAGEERPGRAALARAAAEALERALRTDGREGAFHLLAADAFLTWASEAALDERDPEAALEDLAAAIAVGGAPAPARDPHPDRS